MAQKCYDFLALQNNQTFSELTFGDSGRFATNHTGLSFAINVLKQIEVLYAGRCHLLSEICLKK